MRTITSASGQEETVTTRRSESADAEGITSLVNPSARALFGRINVIHLLEKANLAVSLANERDEILAHASFLDHPVGDLVDQTQWESFLHNHFNAEQCTPWNTLFLHLFVAQPDFARASAKEIMRAVFNAVAELEYICLLSPNVGALEPVGLDEVFEPLQRQTEPGPRCLAFICHRAEHRPKLHIRPARIEDHDDTMNILAEQANLPSAFEQQHFLEKLFSAQSDGEHTAVCESDGVVAGVVLVTRDLDLELLHRDFDLSEFDGFYKPNHDEPAAPGETDSPREEEIQSTGHVSTTPNTVCIQFFFIDKNHESRSADFLPYIFNLFPDVDFLILTVPVVCPEFPLLQSFLRVKPRTSGSLPRDLYVLHRSGLRPVAVRPAVAADRPAVCDLVKGLRLSESLLQDLDRYYQTRRDLVGAALQAFVAHVDHHVVGTVIIRDEQDIEYICARYNIENFIYFSHHRSEEHAQISHLVVSPSFQHRTKHLLKEVLRLAGRSCLFHRLYPPSHSQENSCVHHLDCVLDCAVPVRPRRQIIYPLEELGINAPSRRITEDQPPFALSLISRKLTMEPKVAVNARIVVVGASDTSLSFLEELCFCPHLRFNNLTLVSTHGLPGELNHEDVGFLSTSHAYSSRDLALIPLHSCITVVTGKMVRINRKCKYVSMSGGGKVPYDFLVLCTGLQYQVPQPSGLDVVHPSTSSHQLLPAPSGSSVPSVPSNLFTLNHIQDCTAARRWLQANFLEQEDNAIVYGNGLDIFTTAETLLGLGVRGRRIHLVLTTPDPPGVPCFRDSVVEEAVWTALDKAQVQVHRDCLLAQMNHGEPDPDPLTSVSFTTSTEPLHLQCGVFINLSSRGVDHDAFSSITRSFLVFDYRLVINASFCTNDPDVFAAGPLTKFSRRYYTDEWSHANFNSKEVGRDLAAALLRLFHPTEVETVETPPEEDRLVPLYQHAKVQGGKLPGGYNYLHVTKPSASDLTAPPVKHDGGMATGRVETGNYFSLHLDSYERVETLTCLSLSPLPVSNYLSLYGKQQQLLGRLNTHYQQGLIQDLYRFFRQSWCLAVYHDRFSDFEQELQQQITSNTQDDQSDAELLSALRSSAVKYLTYNRNLLPMFTTPGQL